MVQRLHMRGVNTVRVPATWTCEQLVALKPDGVLLSMRLALRGTLASTLRKAMGILGIQLPERM